MADDKSINIVLESSEKLKLKELMSKIISQKLLVETLSSSEQQELLSLLKKLDLVEDLTLDVQLPDNESSSTQNPNAGNFVIQIFFLLSFIAIFLAMVVIPTFIAFSITSSLFIAILTVIVSTLVSILSFGAYFGKRDWSLIVISTPVILIIFIITVLVFFYIVS